MSDRPSAEATWRSAAGLLGWPGVIALAAIGLAGFVAATTIEPLARVLVSETLGVDDQVEGRDRLADFASAVERDRVRLDGRSMFFVPPEPEPPPPPPPQEEDADDRPPPPPPPPPRRYGGPEIKAMHGESVYFDDEAWRSVGDPASGGVRVVATNPPWSATIEWEEQEWEVELFERTTPRFIGASAEEDG